MKGINIRYCLGCCVVCFSLVISGCISLSNSLISPTPRFYMLSSVNQPEVNKKINITPGVIIGVGPVKIPEYLDRPQIVTKEKQGTLKFDEFDRWGESLDLGIARLIREDLTGILPGAKLTLCPWDPSITVKYQIVAEVVQLDSELDRDMVFVVQWTVINVQNSKAVIIQRSVIHQPIIPQNYSGLAKTLSTACASLSSQVAQALATLEIPPKIKEEVSIPKV